MECPEIFNGLGERTATGGFGDQAPSDRRVSADATLTVFGLEAGKMRDVSG